VAQAGSSFNDHLRDWKVKHCPPCGELRGTIKEPAVKAPGFVTGGKKCLQDYRYLTKGIVISEEQVYSWKLPT